MMDGEATFGQFICDKRKEVYLSAREVAKALGVSAVYICDIEKNRRAAPSGDMLKTLCSMLNLSRQEQELFYDLAGRSKNTVSCDLPEYIMENDIVRAALRTAKEHGIDDKEWEEFIQRIKKKVPEQQVEEG